VMPLYAEASLESASSGTALTSSNVAASQEEPKANSEHESEGLISFDWKIFVSQLINFAVLMYILKMFLFKPAKDVISKRKEYIENLKNEAVKANDEAKELKGLYEGHIANFDKEMEELRKEKVVETQEKVDAMLRDARKKADDVINTAEEQISLEREAAWYKMKGQIVDFTFKTTEKVVESALDEEKHRALIASTIEQLEADALPLEEGFSDDET